MSKQLQISRRLVFSGLVGIGMTVAASGAAVAGEALDRVVSGGGITIGIHNGAPWGYKAEDGSATGFSPDLVRAAFAPLGVKNVKFVITEFGALIPGLTSGRFDAIASGLYITPVRCKAVAFSDPDLSLKDAILVRAGNPKNIHSYADIAANPDLSIGIGRGSANIKNAQNAGVQKDQITLYQDNESTIAALQGGRVDTISFSAPTVIKISRDKNVTGIERAVPFTGWVQENGIEKSGYSAIAFKLDETDLRDAYNRRLAEMKSDGTVAAIMAKYGFTEEESAPALTQEQICNAE